MHIQKYLTVLCLSISSLLTACTDRFDSRDVNAGDADRHVALEFTTDDFTPVLRSALPASEEKRMNNLYVWIFKEGEGMNAYPVFSKIYDRSSLRQAEELRQTKYGDADQGVPTSKGLLEQGMDLSVGNYLVYMVANLPGGDYYSVGESATLFVPEKLSMVTPRMLETVIATLRHPRTFRNKGFLLMSGKELKEVDASTTRIDVRLKRVDARIDFSIGLSVDAVKRGDKFVAKEYSVHNVPGRSFLFEHPTNASRDGLWDAAALENADQHFNTVSRSLDSLDRKTGRSVASFYMPESRKPYQQDIKAALQGKTPAEQYRARAKQVKEERRDNTGVNPYLSNGDFVYAPKLAPYLEIRGEYSQTLPDGLKRTSDVTYRVLLGESVRDVNDYNTFRDCKYTYTLTVNGVNDIITEVKSNKTTGEAEPAPDNDGLIFDSSKQFQLDAHYEQRTFFLKRSDLGPNVNGEIANMEFYISTPFQSPTIIKYSREELKSLAASGFKQPSGKWADNGWLRFYIHPKTDVDPQRSVYYTDMKDSDLLTVEQLMYRLSSDTDNSGRPYAQNDVIKITVFVNENYYEENPRTPDASPDKDLWKKFVNTPDRRFILLVAGKDSPYSPDGQSAHFRSVLTLSQYSIKTVFTSDAGGKVRIWGVESVDETPDVDFSYLYPSEPLSRMNRYFSNGFANTWHLLTGSSSQQGNTDVVLTDFYTSKTDLWKTCTKVGSTGVKLNPDTKLVIKSKNYDYAMFAPFSRNRDNNKDGKMQREEMKWFNPSPAEAVLFVMSQGLLPVNEQFRNKAVYYPTVLWTNRGYRSASNVALNVNNPLTISSGTFSQNYLYEFNLAYNIKAASPGDRTPYSHNRLIRDLGVLDEYPLSDKAFTPGMGHYTNEDLGKELPRTAQVSFSSQDYRFIRTAHLNPLVLRKERVTTELPMHSQSSSVNRIYEKGFEAATYPARPYGANYFDGQRWETSRFYDANDTKNSWQKLQRDINSGHSPCATYWQYSDDPQSVNYDKGTWRVPNMAEMCMMMINMFDWWRSEASTIYGTSFQYPWGNPSDFYNVGTRTGYSGQPGVAELPFAWGYAMHVEGYLRMVGTPLDISRWVKNNQKLFVRCVRDLPE